MTLEDVTDLGTSWAKHPPAHLRLERVERVLRFMGNLPEPEESASSGADSADPNVRYGPVDEAAVRAEVAAINGGGS